MSNEPYGSILDTLFSITPMNGFKMDSKGKKCSHRGFTLLELLVTIAIAGLIFSIVYVTLFQSIKVQQDVIESRRSYRLIQMILHQVFYDLLCVYSVEPYEQMPLIGRSNVMGDRRYDSIVFTAANNYPGYGRLRGSDLVETAYYCRESETENKGDERGKGLFVLYKRIQSPPAEPYDSGGYAFDFTDKILEFKLEYFDGESWRDEWDSALMQRLPRQIKVTVTLANEQENEIRLSTTVELPLTHDI